MKLKSILMVLCILVKMQISFGQAVTGTVTHETSPGAHDGSITLTINGGIAPFTFSWTGPAGYTSTSKDISNLAPGQYCVTVTDALCGTATYCDIVKNCKPILAAATGTRCPYNSNGYFVIILSGGGAPYTIEWSDGPVDHNVWGTVYQRQNMTPGLYCATVTSSYGCTESICRMITPSVPSIQIQGNITQPNCGNPTGGITLSVTGGYNPFTYKWSDGVQTKDRTNLSIGTYTVTATDNKGCTQTASFTVTTYVSNLKVNIKSLQMVEDCFSSHFCDGAIDIEPGGGTAPYTYKWSGPEGFTSNQQDISELCSGDYTVTVTDGYGCTSVKSIHICCCYSEPHGPGGGHEDACNFSDFTISGQVTSATSTQGGSINLSLTGLTGNYSLVWKKNNQFYSYDKNLTNLQPGTYCVTVSNGCVTKDKCFTIVNCDNVNIVISGSTEPTCQNYTAGKVTISVQGGTSPYKYKWSNGSTNQNLTNLIGGTYTVTVSDANGCTKEKSFTVSTTQITIVNQGCTQITKCGNQVISVQEFPPQYQTDPFDCRYIRAVCANGYVGPWEFQGTTLRYPFGPTGCVIQEVCANGQVYAQYNGQVITESIGGLTNDCWLSCVRVRYCYYPELGGYDPNSVQVIGNGTPSYEYIGWSHNCSCLECCKKYYAYCDGEYVGVVEDYCSPSPEGLIRHQQDETGAKLISISEIVHALNVKYPEKVSDKLKYGSAESLPAERKEHEYDLTTDEFTFRLADVYPNPFDNHVTIKVSSGSAQEVTVELLNTNGQLMQKEIYELVKGVNQVEMNVQDNFPAGSYILRITDASGNIENKMLAKMN